MNNQLEEARLAVQKAREALRNNDRGEARKWAEKAASLAPNMEDPWLALAASAEPRESMAYIQRALKINPNSPRAKKGLEWAQTRLRDSGLEKESENSAPPQVAASNDANNPPLTARLPRAASLPALTESGKGKIKLASTRTPLYASLLFFAGLFICAIAAWSATTSPALALLANQPAPTPTHPSAWAQAQIAKPTYTPVSPSSPIAFTPTPAPTELTQNLPANLPTTTSTAIVPATVTGAPTAAPTETATPAAQPSNAGGLTLTFVEDTPTSEAPAASPAPTSASGSQTNYVSSGGERWIDVNLSQQMVYAYEGNTVVKSFVVSTGTWQYPTVTGKYHIYVKYRYTDMTGPGYYLPNVPYTMYFYQGYGLHGTYWHHNFGTPMSHGCVNLSIPDSEWMYNFASVGTLVNVHY